MKAQISSSNSVSLLIKFFYPTTNNKERCLLILAVISAIIQGFLFPFLMVQLGGITGKLRSYSLTKLCGGSYESCIDYFGGNFTLSEAETIKVLDPIKNTREEVQFMIILGCINFTVGFIHSFILTHLSNLLVDRLRKNYFKSFLKRELFWFDSKINTSMTAQEAATHISKDFSFIEEGIGVKLTMNIKNISQTISGIVLGFVYSWQVSLVILGFMPLISFCLYTGVKALQESLKTGEKHFQKASGLAIEGISAIRTIHSLGLQKLTLLKFDKANHEAFINRTESSVRLPLGFAGLFSLLRFSMLASFALGTKLFLDGTAGLEDILSAYFAILIGTLGISSLSSIVELTQKGMTIFEEIDATIKSSNYSTIDPLDEDKGLKINKKDFKGKITFENVHFNYPNKPDRKVLKGITLNIEAGETVAFVGPSGCGKSSIIKLIERFYDANSGCVKIDGQDIKSLNVKNLRSHIGMVKQEPVLFAGTVKENILRGLSDENQNDNDKELSDHEIFRILQKAEAKEFVQKFPKGLETFLGTRGDQLSGGQKQRLAIARTIIRKPKILLLDEATSAIDANSEAKVQEALNQAMEHTSCTTIIIAHRLSTVRKADRIFGIEDGKIVEVGSHDELMEIEGGLYRKLVEVERDSYEKISKRPSKMINSEIVLNSLKKADTTTSKVNLKSSESEHSPQQVNDHETTTYKSTVKVGHRDIIPWFKPEWLYVILGIIAALISATMEVLTFLFMSKIIATYVDPSDKSKVWKEVWKWNYCLAAIGILSFIVYFWRNRIGIISGQILIRRFRYLYLQAVLNQEIGLFDDSEYPTSYFNTRMATDVEKFDAVIGYGSPFFYEPIGGLSCAFILTTVLDDWRLALVAFCFIPFMVLTQSVEFGQTMAKESRTEEKKEAVRIRKEGTANIRQQDKDMLATESLNEISTIMALNCQNKILNQFNKLCDQENHKKLKDTFILAISFGLGDMSIFFMFAAVFRYGLELMIDEDHGIEFDEIFSTVTIVMSTGMAAARSYSLHPPFDLSWKALGKIFWMLRRTSKCDVLAARCHTKGSDTCISPSSYTGVLEFKNVHFTYPSRPNNKVLKGINLKIQPGQTVALVGGSGCGKSTIIQLLNRFYDADKCGKILLDGQDITDLNLNWYRSKVGFVQQEPVLLDGSILENIRCGKGEVLGELMEDTHPVEIRDPVVHSNFAKNSDVRDASSLFTDKIEKALPFQTVQKHAKTANINKFINQQPNKYDTQVGLKGKNLSGGQKQRIAICRTFMREAPILLLDEATSALDNESEKLVNESILKFGDREGESSSKTVVIVAHRLSTIKSADVIVVIDKGIVVETGGHDELVEKRGFYYNLVKAQL